MRTNIISIEDSKVYNYKSGCMILNIVFIVLNIINIEFKLFIFLQYYRGN